MNRFFALSLIALLGTSARAATWALDDAHSDVGFSIKHMMVTDVRGGFDKYTGTIVVDDKDVTKSTVNVEIDSASINTRNAKRDTHLKDKDFLDVAKYPKVTFKSTKVEKGTAPNTLKVTGDLSLHGVTKPVVLDATLTDEWTGPKELGGNVHKGVKATGKIMRKDFGITYQSKLDKGGIALGEEVVLDINAELIKQIPAPPAVATGAPAPAKK